MPHAHAEPAVNIFPSRTRDPLDPGDPQLIPHRNAKILGRHGLRARFDPAILPVPFLDPPKDALTRLANRTDLPERGFWLASEIQPIKLRGLGPADSIILANAIAAGLIPIDRLYLSPMVPWVAQTLPTRKLFLPRSQPLPPPSTFPIDSSPTTPPGEPTPTAETGDVAPDCPDAPMQPDMAIRNPDHVELVEIKPNAGYVALGQVLAYVWNWNRFYESVLPAHPAILTDLPRAYLPGMALDFGITLYTLGQLIVEPPPYPT